MNFLLSKNKHIFDIYNFKTALKRVILIRKTISSCFAAYNNIFGKKVEQSDLFVELLCFCLLKLWNIFFVFRRWYVNEFLFRWQLRYFHDKISLVFVVFLQFFMVFCVFSLPFLSFLESFNQILTQRKQLRMFFIILSFCFARFSFVFNLFFLLYFDAVFFLHYIIICIQKLR